MSLIQFFRILWARKSIIAVVTVSCLIGAVLVILFVPPRYEANARVLLNLLKPDPVTGQVIAGPATKTYVSTQRELIKDYSVAGQVADQLGWLSDPTLIELYGKRGSNDDRDFRRWVAQRVIDRTTVNVVEGSNILEITYSANSAQDARSIAEALRTAYIDASLAFRRADAARDADWYTAQTENARKLLNAAEEKKSAFEREHNIILQDDKVDVDTARLRALAGQASAGGQVMAAPITGPSAASLQLSEIDAMIAQASQSLGPNHPELQTLKARRAAVAAAVAQGDAAARASASAASQAAAAGVGALDRAVAAQKSRVIGQRDKLERLTQLQAEVDLRRDQFNKTAQRAAELRQEAAIADTGLTSLGSAVTPQDPKFPNKPLILVGSLALGGAMGVLLSLLIELFSRRVRSGEDLEGLVDVPLLAVIPAPPRPRRAFQLMAPRRRKLAQIESGLAQA